MCCVKVFAVYVLIASTLCEATAVAGERLHRLVAAAADGETVRVPAGIYHIDRPIVVPENKTLSIVAEDSAGVTVDADGLTNCFVFLSKGANLLRGFTVRNGRGAPCIPGEETWYAGGVVMRGGMIERCRVENCFTESPFKAVGGGIASWGTVKDSVVSNCHVRVKRNHNGSTHPLVCSGGGILLYGGRGAFGCTVTDCSAKALQPGPAVGGYGGGVEVFGTARLENTKVSGCRASMGGGGVHLNSGGHVHGCTIESNSVTVAWRWDGVNLGGGVAVGSASNGTTVDETIFTGNRIDGIDANEAQCGGGGLGVCAADGVAVKNCRFTGNAGFNGGAAYFLNSQARISGCVCAKNTARRLGPNFATSAKKGVEVDRCEADEGGEVMAYPRLFNPATGWMAGKVGVFQHRLYARAPEALQAMRKIDPEAMAEQLADIGADYFCITIHQCAPSFLAPNDVYEDLCGYARGTMCSQRDVPAELAAALKKKGIRLMLYSTGAPPRDDVEGVKRIGYGSRGKNDATYTRAGALNWAKVLEFWSRRYGKSVSGWWIDGCFSSLGFDSPEIGAGALFSAALKSGNPDAVVTFNPGIGFKPWSSYEDYICGEINEPFFESCTGRWVDGRQWHLLTYLYSPLGFPVNVRYTDGEWIEWLAPVIRRGGCVTLDARSLGTGCIQPESAAQLKRVIAGVRGRLDPTGEDAMKIARENNIRVRTDAIDGANTTYEYAQHRFTKCQYAKQYAVPNRSLLRTAPDGRKIWTDAIQATLDAEGGVYLPPTVEPYLLDGPIRLKSGQSLVMGQPVMIGPALRKGRNTCFKAIPGAKGPLIVADGGDADNALRDIYVKGVVFEGCDNPLSFSGVDGLVVREIAFRACVGVGMRLTDVRNFRADGFLTADCSENMMPAALELSGDCRDGMIRNVDAQGIEPVVGETSSVILESLSLSRRNGMLVSSCQKKDK